MLVAELLKLVVRNDKPGRVAKRDIRIILAFDYEDLEAFPPEGCNLLDGCAHILQKVVLVDDGVGFELDSMLLAEDAKLFELLQTRFSIDDRTFDVYFRT